jgi:ubiquinone/menaquinone biosynthesis C-methylase UbiE
MSMTFVTSRAEDYERLMGRWSRVLAQPFLEFSGVANDETVLDVGCGTGSLTLAIADTANVRAVAGIDLTESYIEFARSRTQDSRIRYETGDACALPFADGSFDRTLSLLVLNFIPDAPRAAAEMVRVTRPGGVVAATVWDVRGGLPAFRMFWDTACVLDPNAKEARDRYSAHPIMRPGELSSCWRGLGLEAIEQTEITVRFEFERFADYWEPMLGKTGPVGAYLDGIPETLRMTLEQCVRAAYEVGQPDGPRSFTATAWACRGMVPGN